MKTSLFALYITGPALALLSCAPGKRSGGIGCSKTSSVLKTPTIFSTESVSTYNAGDKADEEEQRSLFFKHYGQFKAKTTGGYVYIRSRAANDVMGAVAADAPWYRCSVMLEFPKHTGEIPDPSVAGSAWFGKSEAQIAAERFPAASDLLKVRIYSAAHCFDYSINEDVVLSVFSASGQDLPSFKNAYTNIALTIPELKAVKDLRTALAAKVAAGTITNQNAVDILKAFQPAVRNMNAVFDVPAGTTEMSSPTPKQSCMLPPKASEGDNAKQYTCATYHDMVVHDVTFSGLPAEQETVLKNMREKWVTQIKKVENEGPDLASATSNEVESPWRNYATEESFRMFIAQIFKPSCKDFFPALAPVCTEDPFTGVTCIPITDPEPAPTVSSCTSNLFPADPTKVVAGDPASEYPKVYTIKLSCEGIAAPDCYEVPINTPQNLHYMRQMTRERLRSFTRYNIVGNLSAMPSDILSCGSGTSGICAAKTEVQTALGTVADGLTLSTASLSPSNFLSSSSPFVKAQKKVDGALDVWKDFFAANDSANTSSPSTDLGANGVIADTDDFPFFKKLLNPINFLDLHSNFIVQDRAVTELPKPENMDLRRAFLKLPINNIIGLDEFSSFSLDSSSNPRPIFIDSWNTGSNVGGRFLRFWTTKNQLNSFLDAVPLESAYGDHFNPIDPNSFIVLFDKPTVDTATDTIAKIPTQTTLQKGDSGSIFTLDGIPMFALSTVNGEPTSGGAAVAAIPVAGPDTDDSLPSGGGSIAAGGGGGSPVASAGVACK